MSVISCLLFGFVFSIAREWWCCLFDSFPPQIITISTCLQCSQLSPLSLLTPLRTLRHREGKPFRLVTQPIRGWAWYAAVILRFPACGSLDHTAHHINRLGLTKKANPISFCCSPFTILSCFPVCLYVCFNSIPCLLCWGCSRYVYNGGVIIIIKYKSIHRASSLPTGQVKQIGLALTPEWGSLFLRWCCFETQDALPFQQRGPVFWT